MKKLILRFALLLLVVQGCSAQEGNWVAPTIENSASINDIQTGATKNCGNSLYVANSNTGLITVYAPQYGKVDRSIAIPQAASGGQSPQWSLAFDSRCNLYAWGGGSLISVFSPGATTPTRTIEAQYKVNGLAVDSTDNLFAGDQDLKGGEVIEYRAGGSGVRQRYLTPYPGAFAIDAGMVYASGSSRAGVPIVYVFSPPGRKPVREISTGVEIAVNLLFDRSRNLYIGNGDVNKPRCSISLYSKYGKSLLRTIGLGSVAFNLSGGYQQMAVDRVGNIYVADAITGAVVVYKQDTTKRLRRITVPGMQASAILLDSNDDLYVASSPKNRTGDIYVFAAYSNKLLRRINAGVASPVALLFGPS